MKHHHLVIAQQTLRATLLLVLSLLVVGFWTIPAYADIQEGGYDQNSVIVCYKASNEQSALSALSVDEGYTVKTLAETETATIAKVTLPESVSVDQAISQLEENPRISYVQPNYRYRLVTPVASETADEAKEIDPLAADIARIMETLTVNDPYAALLKDSGSVVNQWYLANCNALEAWNDTVTDHEVTVAVIDTGINFEHEDLAGVIDAAHARQFGFDDNGNVVESPYTESETDINYLHGSHVAGIIAAEANNGVGFAGVSYNANIIPLQVFFDYYDSTEGWIAVTDDSLLIPAFNYLFDLVDNGLDNLHVVNMSLGGTTYDRILEQTITKAKNEYNILSVCAAGNDGSSAASYPSDYEACTSVVAIGSTNQRASWSDYGSAKDIAAPGVNIWSCSIGATDAAIMTSGTSMAAPVVSGVAALLWAKDPTLTVDEVQQILYETAADLGSEGFDPYYGWGRVDAAAALAAISTVHVTAEDRTYTGKAITGNVNVISLEGTYLRANVDYTLAFFNADGVEVDQVINAGEYKVVATSTENYEGGAFSRSARFTVAPRQLDEGGVLADIADQEYTGGPIIPALTVTYNNEVLAVNRDYTVTCSNNISCNSTASVQVNGVGNYAGTLTGSFAIVPHSLSDAFMDAVPNQSYNGKAFKPVPLIRVGSTQLVAGLDYRLVYSNNINAGTATVAALGMGNYCDSVSGTFAINPRSLTAEGITVQAIPNQTYTGAALSPAVTITDEVTGETLKQGTDFAAIYSNNVELGTATVLLFGMNNYTTNTSVTFEIVESGSDPDPVDPPLDPEPGDDSLTWENWTYRVVDKENGYVEILAYNALGEKEDAIVPQEIQGNLVIGCAFEQEPAVRSITFPEANLFGDDSMYFYLTEGCFTQGVVKSFYFLGSVPAWGINDELNMYDVFGPRTSATYTIFHTTELVPNAEWNSVIDDFNEVMTGVDGGDSVLEKTFAVPLQLSLDYDYLHLNPGNTFTLTATLAPNPSLYPSHLRTYLSKLTWITGNKDVVTVDNGKLTAISAGEAVVTVIDSMGHFAQATVVIDDQSTTTPDFKGSGTQADPYQISSAQNLLSLSEMLQTDAFYQGRRAWYVLTNDIDLSSYPDFTPLGSMNYPFRGHFDGAGHTITLGISKGIDDEGVGPKDQALFGFVMGSPNNRATISNLIVDGSVTTTGGSYTAGIVARCDYLDLYRCQNAAAITGSYYTGGIVGYASCVPDIMTGNLALIGATSIVECCNTGAIVAHPRSANNSYCKYVGGIAGYLRGASQTDGAAGATVMRNCYNAGTVTSDDDCEGGLVGRVSISGSNWTLDDEDDIGTCSVPAYVPASVAQEALEAVAPAEPQAATSQQTLGVLIENCFNYGVVSTTKTTSSYWGVTNSALVGSYDANLNDPDPQKFVITNCHYLDQGVQGIVDGSDKSSYVTITDSGAVSAATMATSAFADQMGSAYVRHLPYPVFEWQAPQAEPVISETSAAQVVRVSETVSLNVTAALPAQGSGANGILSYQWCLVDNETGSNPVAVVGATRATYQFQPAETGVFYYVCQVTNTYNSGEDTATATSDVVKVTVLSLIDAAKPVISQQPTANTQVMLMTPVELSLSAGFEAPNGQGTLTYQWYLIDGAKETAVEGATEASFAPSTNDEGTFTYVCRVTNTFEEYKTASTDSNTATVVVEPAIISSPADLEKLQVNVAAGATYAGKTVTLASDLDLSAYAAWQPIGSKAHPFQGTFDGQGHRISNLTVAGTEGEDWGLFGYVSNGVVIKNLIVSGSVSGPEGVGGITGHSYGQATFTNVGFEGSLYCTGSLAVENLGGAGGIIGRVGNGGIDGSMVTVENCYNKADILCDGNSAGGIVGTSGTDLEIKNCYNWGTVHARNKAGGIVGIGYYQFDDFIVNCYNAGNVSISDEVDDATALYGAITGGNAYYFANREYTVSAPSYFLDTTCEVSQSTTAPYEVGTLPLRVTIDQLVSSAFAKALGSNFKANFEGRYPLLAWENAEVSDAISLADATVTLEYESSTYNGAAQTPAVTVAIDGAALVEGTDYRVSYSANTNAGTAKAVVLGKGNYVGSVVKPFTIAPLALDASSIADVADQVFSAKDLTPSLSISALGTALSKDKDYSVTFADNYHAGTGHAVVSFCGNYKGTTVVSFTITRRALNDKDVQVGYIPNQTYDGTPCTPAPQFTLNKVALVEGTDFSIDSYSDNDQAGIASIQVSGMGDFSGSRTVQFRIEAAEEEAALFSTVTASSLTLNMGAQFPTVTVMDTKGATLEFGTDYTLTYTDSLGDTVTALTKPGRFTVTAAGTGAYAGCSLSATFTVSAKQLGHQSVLVGTLADQTYTGQEIEPAVSLSDSITGRKLIAGMDYVVEYENNVNPGQAQALVTGIGSYTGTLTLPFTIGDGEPQPQPQKTPADYARLVLTQLLGVNQPSDAQVNAWASRFEAEPALNVVKDALSNQLWAAAAHSNSETVALLSAVMLGENALTQQEMAAWEAYLAQGYSQRQLADSFANMRGFGTTVSTYHLVEGGTYEETPEPETNDTEAYVKMLFNNLLGIAKPTSGQLAYWVEQVESEGPLNAVEDLLNSSLWKKAASTTEQQAQRLLAGMTENTTPTPEQLEAVVAYLEQGNSCVDAAMMLAATDAYDAVCKKYHLTEGALSPAKAYSYASGLTLIRLNGADAPDAGEGAVLYRGTPLLWISGAEAWCVLVESPVERLYACDFSVSDALEPELVVRPGAASDSLLAGDVNINGDFNIVDAQLAYDMATGITAHPSKVWEQARWLTADVNCDNVLDAADALAIQSAVLRGWK